MSFAPLVPVMLDRADFAMVRFTLDLITPCRLEPFALLGLRRGLLRAGRELFGAQADGWFAPQLSNDPAAVKRFQKPAPAFVLRPELLQRAVWQEGDSLVLDVLFLGDGLSIIDDFAALLRNVGRCGLVAGDGRFEVAGQRCYSAAGHWRTLQSASSGASGPPDVLSLGNWLDDLLPLPSPFFLELLTPARLLAGGRALRRPRFSQLLPFMLRRVTSMLYYHCHLEPVDDPSPLLAAARQIESTWGAAEWVDWHELDSGSKVGGLTGQLRLSGGGLEELDWVIALATLFGIGRGAAYGAGRLRLASAKMNLLPGQVRL